MYFRRLELRYVLRNAAARARASPSFPCPFAKSTLCKCHSPTNCKRPNKTRIHANRRRHGDDTNARSATCNAVARARIRSRIRARRAIALAVPRRFQADFLPSARCASTQTCQSASRLAIRCRRTQPQADRQHPERRCTSVSSARQRTRSAPTFH